MSGETYSLISPVCNTEAMNEFLAGLHKTFSHEQLLVFLDAAGWHQSHDLHLPAALRLQLLPPYSPELNPTEHLWDYIREQKQFNNYCFESIDQLEDHLCKVLKDLAQEKDYIRSLYHLDARRRHYFVVGMRYGKQNHYSGKGKRRGATAFVAQGFGGHSSTPPYAIAHSIRHYPVQSLGGKNRDEHRCPCTVEETLFK